MHVTVKFHLCFFKQACSHNGCNDTVSEKVHSGCVEMSSTKSAPLVEQVDRLTEVSTCRSVNSPVNKSTTVIADNSEVPYRSKSETIQNTYESKPVNLLLAEHANGMGGDGFGFEQVSGVVHENSISMGDSSDNLVGSSYDVPVSGINSATVADTEQQKDLAGDSSEESVAFPCDVRRHDGVVHDVRASHSCADLTSGVGSMDLDCAAIQGENN
jgi:hypothetical protein